MLSHIVISKKRILIPIMLLAVIILFVPSKVLGENEQMQKGSAIKQMAETGETVEQNGLQTNTITTDETEDSSADSMLQTCGSSCVSTVNLTGTYCQSEARKMLQLVNNFRTGSNAWYWNETNTAKVKCTGLGKLTYDYALEATAMQRAAEIAVSFSHYRPNGTMFFTAYPENIYTCAGENIAYSSNYSGGFITAASMFNGWAEANEKYSGQGHRRKMLDKYFSAIGIGCFKYNNCYYWVMELGSPNSGKAATSALNTSKTMQVKVLNGSHSYQTTTTTKATLSSNGKIVKKCLNCGTATSTTIYRPATFTLSTISYAYNGKVKTPSLTIKDAAGKTISPSYYTVKKSSGRTAVGLYSYIVTFKGNYSGTKYVYFKIVPKTAAISGITIGKKSITVKASMKASSLAGSAYQIAYRKSGTSQWYYTTTTSQSKLITGLTSGKKYEVRVRAYKKVGSTMCYGGWSAVKTTTAVK